MSSQELIDFILTLERRINHTLSENDVKQYVIQPVLHKLGWDVFSPEEVINEYRVDTGRVDYALRIGDRIEVFLEVKKPSEEPTLHEDQLLRYSFAKGVNLAVLTNGVRWLFFLPTEVSLEWKHRKIADISIYNANKFANFTFLLLSKEYVISGKHIEVAKSLIAEKTYIPKAWNALLEEADDILIELLKEKVKAMFNFEPPDGVVRNFLKGELRGSGIELSTTYNRDKTPVEKRGGTEVKFGKERKYSGFILDYMDSRQEFRYISDLVIYVLREFSKDRPDFLEKFSQYRTKKRKYIAKDIYDLYSGRPDLCEKNNKLITKGWYLGTNYSVREFKEILNLACKVAGFNCRFEDINGTLKIQIMSRRYM